MNNSTSDLFSEAALRLAMELDEEGYVFEAEERDDETLYVRVYILGEDEDFLRHIVRQWWHIDDENALGSVWLCFVLS